ncbi:hypothetical protein [uncultured Gordonia sp.]|uniref:hypothetical protein n=1 Tax=uncultured Gordonia sp. TaxID=198437 RepID=UPI0025958DB3|nr:hypothetical protein [uncultured Gordonia sp.]
MGFTPQHTHDEAFHVDRTGGLAPGMTLTTRSIGEIGPLSRHGERYVLGTAGYLEHAMENFWELFRATNHPDKLSRFAAVFAWETYDDARRFGDKFGTGDVWVVTGSSHPQTHRADMNLLRAGNLVDMTMRAEQYWTGEASDDPQWELLLPAPVTVIRATSPVEP